MSKLKRPEILAPAGSFESLEAAFSAGADAIYFGVEQLNMRTRSTPTFTIEDIQEIVSRCRKNNVRCYLTLNTVMYEHDMQLLKTILSEVKVQGVDAVIASDFAVIEFCNRENIDLHISTQANVSNIEAVQFFSRFSNVIVLARELTLQQVGNIKKEIIRRKIKGPAGELVKIEIFVHGALCVAVSGKCYMSLHTHNASANRGACVQNCRRSYVVTDKETGDQLEIDNHYIMSPKDLCTIDILDQVLDSGVDVLKIEGRTKGPDYVYTVTKSYREAVEAIAVKTYTQQKALAWKEEMKKVYNRDFWEGYYLGRKLGEWTVNPGSAAKEKKVYVGKGVKYFGKIGIGEFFIESGSLKKGDSLMVTSPKFGFKKYLLESLIVNGEISDTAEKGDSITIPIDVKISPTDKLYKVVDA
jgi:putative protease